MNNQSDYNPPVIEPAELGPNAEEAERIVLGMCLDDTRIFPRIAPKIQASHFYFLRNGYIFQAMQNIYERDEDVHMLAVIYELRRLGKLDEIGGVNYLSHLTEEPLVEQKELAEVMAGLIFAAAIRCQLMNACGGIASRACKENAVLSEIVEFTEMSIYGITRQVTADGGQGEVSSAQAASVAADRLLAYTQDQQNVRGYSSGITKLDAALHGIQPEGDLIGVIGRSGAGKTTVMCQFAIAALEAGIKVVLFPTEQTVDQYMLNLVSHYLKRPLDDLYAGRIAHDDILHAEQVIKAWPLTFYDRTGPSPSQVTSFTREKRREGLCDLVLVDGLSDMFSPAKDTYQKTVECMTALHSLMRDKIPVVFTVQTNRGPAKRSNKHPLPSDAQGGEIIFQKCTRFLSLYRPGYDVETGEIEESDLDAKYDPDYVEIRVVKDRWFNAQGSTVKAIWIAGRGLQDASARATDNGNGRAPVAAGAWRGGER